MSLHSSLTTSQQETLVLIASGATAYDAAAIAGVHRHTVANWLRSSEFREALDAARYHQALLRREQAESLAAEAYQTVRAMLADPQVPAAVRLKAALAIIDRAPDPLPQPPESPEMPEFMSKNVQPSTANQQLAAPLRNEPNTPPPAATVKIGRNDPCPCGSGLKFKRCCIGKPAAPASQPPLHAYNGPQ